MRWAALLRGINLGKRQLKSAELKAAVESLGYRDVRTILASGNVVFTAPEADPGKIEAAVHAALAAHTGLRSDVFVRNAAELDAAIAANPFEGAARERPSRLVVTFHRDPVPQAPLDWVAQHYDGPERLARAGRELFTDYPDGQARSGLIPLTNKAGFPKVCTGRNWNTVGKVRAALDG